MGDEWPLRPPWHEPLAEMANVGNPSHLHGLSQRNAPFWPLKSYLLHVQTYENLLRLLN